MQPPLWLFFPCSGAPGGDRPPGPSDPSLRQRPSRNPRSRDSRPDDPPERRAVAGGRWSSDQDGNREPSDRPSERMRRPQIRPEPEPPPSRHANLDNLRSIATQARQPPPLPPTFLANVVRDIARGTRCAAIRRRISELRSRHRRLDAPPRNTVVFAVESPRAELQSALFCELTLEPSG